MPTRETTLKILELARWAPSGDNTQPWRFELLSTGDVAVHGFDTRDWCLYDYHGHASHMAHGALLETLRIAATAFGVRATWRLREGSQPGSPIYDVLLEDDSSIQQDPLFPYIEARTVQRRPMRTTPLSSVQKTALEKAVGPEFKLRLFESAADRRKLAKVLWDGARIRLTCPEAFPVHREIIEWGARYSKDRIPEAAVGVDHGTARLMKWVMHDWKRVDFFNRYLLGTIIPRIQLDVLPALQCAAHVLLMSPKPLKDLLDYVHAGAAMQRLWLTATLHGLFLQPEMTPLIFRWYARAGERFSALDELGTQATKLAERLESVAVVSTDAQLVFMGRVGVSETPKARSLRQDVEALMTNTQV